MKATFVDLRKKSAQIIRALNRNETITVYYRGRPKAVMTPIATAKPRMRAADHPACGMWADREDMKDVHKWLRNLRKPRHHDL
jgi:antitoxin (DNA-binding transcriptional repressor) of toxin-antitoxin stability system